jgi:hypothetical protein
MAKQLKVTIVDDLTGTEIAEGIEPEKRNLTWKGKHYELDLTPDSAKKVDAALEKILANVPASSGKAAKGTKRTSTGDAAKIRAWAKEQGIQINDRGRINSEVVEAYKAGHKLEAVAS